jgi:cobalt-zinc-cadmium efflux system membrane fusion protein
MTARSQEPKLGASNDGPEPPIVHRTHVTKVPRGRVVFTLLGAAGLVLFGWVFVRSDEGKPARAAEPKTGNDAPILDGDLIRFSDAFAKRAGLTAEPVKPAELTPFVTVGGTLTHDPRRRAAVGARIQGRVRRVFKFIGDEVKRGENLVEIESAELGRAEASVLAARAKEKAAEADMKRERHLAEQRITSQRDAEFAQATYEAARAERVATERAVEALGGTMDHDFGVLVLKSPIAGRIVAASTSLGATVDPTETLFEVAELSSLWVELHVFERELGGVRRGNAVEITAPGAHEHVIRGKVDHVGEIIDVDTRTAPVRVVVANEHHELRPGQSVVARISTSGSNHKTLTIPRPALTRIDGKPMVFVMHDKNTVEPRAVTTGPEDAERVAIHDGLKENERVVLGGMFALKSEIFR